MHTRVPGCMDGVTVAVACAGPPARFHDHRLCSAAAQVTGPERPCGSSRRRAQRAPVDTTRRAAPAAVT